MTCDDLCSCEDSLHQTAYSAALIKASCRHLGLASICVPSLDSVGAGDADYDMGDGDSGGIQSNGNATRAR